MHFQKYLLASLVTILGVMLFTVFAHAQGLSDVEKNMVVSGGLIEYYWLGTTHMLNGYDHLLFIFGVVFFLTSFLDVVKYITGFTLGHTLTLIFATYTQLHFNYYLVDAFVALSIVYIAFVNLRGFEKYFNCSSPNLILMVFIFGLIHGLGLSTRLQELPLNTNNMFSQILSFNVGVEAGQLMALAAMLLLIRIFKHNNFHTKVSAFVNFSLGFCGILLFLMQMHGFLHSQETVKPGLITEQSKVQNIIR